MVKWGDKRHLWYILILVVILLIHLYSYLDFGKMYYGDFVASYSPRAEFIKQSLKDYGKPFPLWSPYWQGGGPFFAKGYLGTDSLLISVLFLPVTAALKLNFLIDFIIAGISMYFLVYYLYKRHDAAFIAAFIYVFNEWIMSRFQMTHLSTLNGYAFAPLIFLFAVRAFKEKDWVKNAVITGILFGIQVRVGPDLKVFLFIAMIFAVYVLFFLIGKNFYSRLTKAALIVLLVSVIVFGISAQRILPMKEYIDISAKGNLPYEESRSRIVHWNSELFTRLIEPVYKGMPDARRNGHGLHVGIIAFSLAAVALIADRKKKLNWVFLASIILCILIATGSFVYYFLWKYIPPFGSFRYLDRAIFMFAFIISILAGAGAVKVMDWSDKKFKLNKFVSFSAIILLLILNLIIFNYSPYRPVTEYKMLDTEEAIKNNNVLQYVSKQPGIFRVQTYETRGIDWGTEFYTVPLKLEPIFGYDVSWYPPYMNGYLSAANAQEAKLWGILNTKYVTSMRELNNSDFIFVKKFEECGVCFNDLEQWHKAYGPYLYENKRFLPRAYFINNTILVIGEKNSVTQSTYFLMLDDNFNPESTIIVMAEDKKINDYDMNLLKRFSAVILLKDSVDSNSGQILNEYVNSGGILLPNIVKGETDLTKERIQNVLASFKGDIKQVPDKNIVTHNFDKKEILLNGDEEGFLVLSETYSNYPGWKISPNKELKMLKADGVITAVYVPEGTKSILLEYRPGSYFIGMWISIISVILLIFYFVSIIIKKKLAQ